jgi:hypothetical protein
MTGSIDQFGMRYPELLLALPVFAGAHRQTNSLCVYVLTAGKIDTGLH